MDRERDEIVRKLREEKEELSASISVLEEGKAVIKRDLSEKYGELKSDYDETIRALNNISEELEDRKKEADKLQVEFNRELDRGLLARVFRGRIKKGRETTLN